MSSLPMGWTVKLVLIFISLTLFVIYIYILFTFHFFEYIICYLFGIILKFQRWCNIMKWVVVFNKIQKDFSMHNVAVTYGSMNEKDFSMRNIAVTYGTMNTTDRIVCVVSQFPPRWLWKTTKFCIIIYFKSTFNWMYFYWLDILWDR